MTAPAISLLETIRRMAAATGSMEGAPEYDALDQEHRHYDHQGE